MKREERSDRGDLGERTVEAKDKDMEKMIEAEEQEKGKEGWRARTRVKGVTRSCPHHQHPVLIYPEQSIRSGGRH